MLNKASSSIRADFCTAGTGVFQGTDPVCANKRNVSPPKYCRNMHAAPQAVGTDLGLSANRRTVVVGGSENKRNKQSERRELKRKAYRMAHFPAIESFIFHDTVRPELVEALQPFDKLRANGNVLSRIMERSIDRVSIQLRGTVGRPVAAIAAGSKKLGTKQRLQRPVPHSACSASFSAG